jgi:hypothetical protein
MQMQVGVDPMTALQNAMAPIIKFYPSFHGAMIAVNIEGKYGMFKEATNIDYRVPLFPKYNYDLSSYQYPSFYYTQVLFAMVILTGQSALQTTLHRKSNYFL